MLDQRSWCAHCLCHLPQAASQASAHSDRRLYHHTAEAHNRLLQLVFKLIRQADAVARMLTLKRQGKDTSLHTGHGVCMAHLN